MKAVLRRLLPESLILGYHATRSWFEAARCGFPAHKMHIIGVTGTKGKTSTSVFIWSVLRARGQKVGLLSTALLSTGGEATINAHHMTMLGAAHIHKLLNEMVKNGCTACVIETSSEGLKQYRHVGISYDTAVFTNLTPEHLPAHHNSFDEYKAMKGRLFASLKGHKKVLNGVQVPSRIIVNADSEHAPYFLSFVADQKKTVAIDRKNADLVATRLEVTADGVAFSIKDQRFVLRLPGAFNVRNALLAVAVGQAFGLTDTEIQKGLQNVSLIPGRMERIEEGQPFTVFVDYAHERESMNGALEAARLVAAPKNGRVIVLLGAEGGGRDPRKRPLMGERAAALADFVVVSNVDPYEDDPLPIAEDIAKASEASGKIRETNLFVILDRKMGIEKCFAIAQPGDVVILTGKGAEQSICIDGKTTPWDDREVARELLKKRYFLA